jgi:hypothetical protein
VRVDGVSAGRVALVVSVRVLSGFVIRIVRLQDMARLDAAEAVRFCARRINRQNFALDATVSAVQSLMHWCYSFGIRILVKIGWLTIAAP